MTYPNGVTSATRKRLLGIDKEKTEIGRWQIAGRRTDDFKSIPKQIHRLYGDIVAATVQIQPDQSFKIRGCRQRAFDNGLSFFLAQILQGENLRLGGDSFLAGA